MKILNLFAVMLCIGIAVLLLGSCGQGVTGFKEAEPTLRPSPAPTLTHEPGPPLPIVTGSVSLEGGSCCAGATAGQTITLHADLAARSESSRVQEMRVWQTPGCQALPDKELEKVKWEPFAESKAFPFKVPINWVGFYVSAQFRDEHGNFSPVYCDDISVEGMPPVPMVDPASLSQVQCFEEYDVHPGPGEKVNGPEVTFNWPDKNDLPEGVFYRVFAFGEVDDYLAKIADGTTREDSLTVKMAPENKGDIVWYVVLVDEAGTFLDHGRCGSFQASLLTVDPPEGIRGIHFQYQP